MSTDPPSRFARGLTWFVVILSVVLLGISMDAIYQFRVYDRFFPVEALLMAVLLAVVPYFLFRGIIGRVARWSFARKGR